MKLDEFGKSMFCNYFHGIFFSILSKHTEFFLAQTEHQIFFEGGKLTNMC